MATSAEDRIPEMIVGFHGIVIGAVCRVPEWKIKPVLQEHRIYLESGQKVASVTARLEISLPLEILDIFDRFRSKNKTELPDAEGELKIIPLSPGDSSGFVFPNASISSVSSFKPDSNCGRSFKVCFKLYPDERGRFLIKLPCRKESSISET
ncbi:hypothetical protein P0136_01370 [Lentisphaerota bacterium ZTH]|nr:hypothetical protein JYG24_07490 [Lentisphaerota bacterium]WET06664.1 hypothetical protein P0136_01370 [Lentisphaerota bacterium ZTH]